jgi:tetratricopeptide (TPR) repeat protein
MKTPTDTSLLQRPRPGHGVLVLAAICGMWVSLAGAEVLEDAVEAQPPPTLDDLIAEIVDPLDEVAQRIDTAEFEPAEQWLNDHIRGIEADSHRFDDRLVRPLTLLGDALTGQDRYVEALEHYQRAVHLTRVNQGLTDPSQVAIVYREANAYKALGDFEQANGREEYAYHVLSRAYDADDEALLPGIYHLARWYQATHNVFAARALYEQAVRILHAHDKAESPAAVPALQGLALSYRLERFPRLYGPQLDQTPSNSMPTSSMRQPITVNNFPAGESALQQVIRIRQAHQPDDPVAVAESVLDLADWYTLFDKNRRAEPLYGHAWEILASAGNVDVVSYFAEPQLLYFPAPAAPNPPAPEQRGEPITGFVEVAFDVTTDGQVRSLTTVASEPDGLMDFRVRKSLRVARYRPMLVDGVPVAKAGHTYRHEFPYFSGRPADADEVAGSTALAHPDGGRL